MYFTGITTKALKTHTSVQLVRILTYYLHVSRLCSFHSCVHQTLTTGHGVEEELCGRQARIEAVGYKTFCGRQLLKEQSN